MWKQCQAKLRLALLVSMLCALGTGIALSPAHAGRIEAGSFTAHATNGGNPNPVRVNFQQRFDIIPIVIALSDNNGSDAAAIRITNISTTGFDEIVIESDSFDGPHAAQNIHYLAVEPGRHVLPDGSIIEAGIAPVSAVQHGSGVTGAEGWAPVSFSLPMPTTPGVISQLQTANSETRTVASQTSQPFITATLNNPSISGFELALERSEVSGGPIPSSEMIGWIAFPAGLNGTFPDISDSPVTWSAVNSGTNISGWDNGCFTNGFGQSSANAIVVAKKNSHIGGDGGWLRRCSLNSNSIGLTVDEDTSRDTERAHTGESASIIAFSRSFHARLEPSISISITSISFTDGTGSGFALPKAEVEYLITAENGGNAPPNHNSIFVTEELPSQQALVITDYSGPASGPVQFAEGASPSGLNCTFAGFADMNDCYAFSTDGTNFSYQPEDIGDGTDPLVTHIRARPTGFMAPNSGAGSTSFLLRFKAKIK